MNAIFDSSLWLSMGVIFVAELGDKSQLMALAFAASYRAPTVLAGITAATAVVHLASVAIGGLLDTALPTRPINILAGAAFLAFAAWTVRGDRLTEDDEARAAKRRRSAFAAVAITFFLAELGDKTMLATITLAAREPWLATWLGSTVGMVAADALAIVAGRALGKRLPERAVRIGAAVSFVLFGLLLLVQGIAG